MKHTICCIDDRIPVSQYPEYFKETDIINEQVIRFLLVNNEDWEDPSVKSLFEYLLKNESEWAVNAFTNPAFYDNYCKEVVYSPDIFVYDWDYGFAPASSDSEEYLYEILANSYSMVFIFSGADSFDDIEEIAKSSKFATFRDRLELIRKNDTNSVEQIFARVKEKEESNFSFRYGHDIVFNSNAIINKILSDISKLSIEEYVSSIGSFDGNKYISTNKDFVDAIMPRYKNLLRNLFPMQEFSIKKTSEPKLEDVRRVWSYRLYDKTQEDYVNMGDLIKDSENHFYVVASSDCHMLEFWKKNFGYIALVPIYQVNSEEVKESINYLGKKNTVNITSLTNNKQSSLTILPCVPMNGDELADFVLIPKSLISIKVNKPEGQISSLKYKDFVGFEKVTSISDPFKSPLIQFVFDNISGYGCPDFPDVLKADINKTIKQIQS